MNPVGRVGSSLPYGESAIYGEVSVYSVCMSVLSGLGYQIQREFVFMPFEDLNVIVKRHFDEDKYNEFVSVPKMTAFNQQKQ